MTASDEIYDLAYGKRVAELTLSLEKARAGHNATRSALRQATKEIAKLERQATLFGKMGEKASVVPKWVTAKPKRGDKSSATVCSILSDVHYDQVTEPNEVDGTNAYNRAIAEARTKIYFEKLISIPRDHFSGANLDGIVVFMLGDMLSGDIHQELVETNEGTILESVLHWSLQLAAGVEMLAEHYPHVHIVCAYGNHGRRTPKEKMKRRAVDNFDYLLMEMTRRAVSAENVTWQIPSSIDARATVKKTTYLATHGSIGFSGGGGIAGPWTAVTRGYLKRRERDEKAGNPFDILLLGHFHTLRFTPTWILNGSMSGSDEYSHGNAFGLELPQQALWLETYEYGPFGFTPLVCAPLTSNGKIDRRKEGW